MAAGALRRSAPTRASRPFLALGGDSGLGAMVEATMRQEATDARQRHPRLRHFLVEELPEELADRVEALFATSGTYTSTSRAGL